MSSLPDVPAFATIVLLINIGLVGRDIPQWGLVGLDNTIPFGPFVEEVGVRLAS